MSEIRIKGLSELQKQLNTIAPRLQANVLRGALREGAKPIAEAAKKNAPVGPTNTENEKLYGGYEGALRDSIRVGSKIDRRSGNVIAYARAGGKSKRTKADVFYAHIVEFGARPHSVKKGVKIGSIRHDATHPGIRPRPFMRPALDANVKNAIIAAGEYIKKRLQMKHGLDTKDIEIGIDDE
jgi:HK97 gp10 family phage protein